MEHDLKCVPPYFEEILSGNKTFEVRVNDRDFQRDDTLLLREWQEGGYTGRILNRKVTYVLHGGVFGLEHGSVVMGIQSVCKSTVHASVILVSALQRCATKFKEYAELHRAKGAGHENKVEVNLAMASMIDNAIDTAGTAALENVQAYEYIAVNVMAMLFDSDKKNAALIEAVIQPDKNLGFVCSLCNGDSQGSLRKVDVCHTSTCPVLT